jgi:hypothetical protein
MWQVEDLIRACHLRMEELEARVIAQYDQPEEMKREIRRWYRELTAMMRVEGVTEKGHLRINRDVVTELRGLHLRLLKSPQETVYGALYYRTLPAIVQLRSLSGGEEMNETETCLTAVYGYVMLKMQQKEISAETEDGIRQISSLLTFLAARFREENTPGAQS